MSSTVVSDIIVAVFICPAKLLLDCKIVSRKLFRDIYSNETKYSRQ